MGQVLPPDLALPSDRQEGHVQIALVPAAAPQHRSRLDGSLCSRCNGHKQRLFGLIVRQQADPTLGKDV
jgi:hypothetical protein